MSNYGERIELLKNIPVVFPDFTIEYLGEERIEKPNLAVKYFTYKNYKITTKAGDQLLRWSSGMGLLHPLKFEVEGITYSFEPYKHLTKVGKYYNQYDWSVTGYIISLKFGNESFIVLPVIRDKKRDNYLFLPTNPEIDISQKLQFFNREEKYKVGECVYIKITNELQYSSENLYMIRRNPLTDTSSIQEILYIRITEEVIEKIYQDTYIKNQIKNFE